MVAERVLAEGFETSLLADRGCIVTAVERDVFLPPFVVAELTFFVSCVRQRNK